MIFEEILVKSIQLNHFEIENEHRLNVIWEFSKPN